MRPEKYHFNLCPENFNLCPENFFCLPNKVMNLRFAMFFTGAKFACRFGYIERMQVRIGMNFMHTTICLKLY